MTLLPLFPLLLPLACTDAAEPALGDTAAADLLPLPAVADLPEQPSPPDPLVRFADGAAITSAEDWAGRRWPELDRLFQHYVYGYSSLDAPSAEVIVDATHADALGGLGTLVELTVRWPGASAAVLVALPADAEGPVPLILGLNKCGNHSVIVDERLSLAAGWVQDDCPTGRGGRADHWALDVALAEGIGVATVHQSDLAPDDPDRFAEDSAHLRLTLPAEANAETTWGAIGAWAWGLQRVSRALREGLAEEVGEVVVFGHSRRGKAALWAAARDEAIAGAWAHQSGTAGAALTRGSSGEPIQSLTHNFPHWLGGLFPLFAGEEARLPVDQHLLLAMSAPRPLLLTDGEGDFWANPDGAREAAALASPVWALLGAEGAAPRWESRPGGHDVRPEDWVIAAAFVGEFFP